jgi:hypothetical protein
VSDYPRYFCPVAYCEEEFSRLTNLILHLKDIHNWKDVHFDEWLSPHFKLTDVGTGERDRIPSEMSKIVSAEEDRGSEPRSSDDSLSCSETSFPRTTDSLCVSLRKESSPSSTENVFLFSGGGDGG